MIDLCSDSEESCTVQDARPENGTVQDARPENDSNTSRKNQKRIERKHHHDLQDGFQSRLAVVSCLRSISRVLSHLFRC